MNIVNLRDRPVEVEISCGTAPIEARNLLSLGGKDPVRTLAPMDPVLAKLEN